MQTIRLIISGLLALSALLLAPGCCAPLCGQRPDTLTLPYGVGWNKDGKRATPREAEEQCARIYNPSIEKASKGGVNLGGHLNWPPLDMITVGLTAEMQEKYNQLVDFQQSVYYRYIESCQERQKFRQCIDDPRGVLNLTEGRSKGEAAEFDRMVEALLALNTAITRLHQPNLPTEVRHVFEARITHTLQTFEPPARSPTSIVFPVPADPRSSLVILARSVDALEKKTSMLEERMSKDISQIHNTTNTVQTQITFLQEDIRRAGDKNANIADAVCIQALLRRSEYLQAFVEKLSARLVPTGDVSLKVGRVKPDCLTLEMTAPLFKSCQASLPPEGDPASTHLTKMVSSLQEMAEVAKDELFGGWDSQMELIGFTDKLELAPRCGQTFGNNLGLATTRALSFMNHLQEHEKPGGGTPGFFLGGVTDSCEPCMREERALLGLKSTADKLERGRREEALKDCQDRYSCRSCGADTSGSSLDTCLRQSRKLKVRARWCISKPPPECETSLKTQGPTASPERPH